MPFPNCCIGLLIIPSTSPVIDGQFNDWRPSSNRSEWSIQGHADDRSISLFLQQPGPATVFQQLDEPLSIGLDLDDDIETGRPDDELKGCDLIFELSPSAGGRRRGGVRAIKCRNDGFQIIESPYQYGFVLAPSTASRRHEIRLDRANLPGIGKRVRTVVRPREGIAIEQSIAIPDSRQTIARIVDSREGDDSTRVVGWNIEYGGILKIQASSIRAENAKPDICFFRRSRTTSRQVKSSGSSTPSTRARIGH